ncbi:hypothetical protein Asppvi_009042 [Aspergillus pseudoviridinutans]|uniref:Uncharacterized protein n=1 Tax=Aspergillus pseudoviridinutans TaxID=1517512 RepID=A0A9P3BEX2_9EURO|nr:uncharacterized protein Asppvi_009042 [Aspergillus pseudoviridinutans]GIJ90092.1 hypothetical protein Asppvi_009042 [Aspergillus pseudoviridinutans]
MRFLQLLSVSLAAGVLPVRASSCPPFPSSMVEFSSEFKQPDPPMVKAEYETNFIQHKWNQNLSHITTGFINNSPSQNFVRVDEAFEGGLASSFFNYTNTTKEGLVDNTLTTFGHESNEPTIWRGYVNSNFPLFPEDILVQSGAVFSGLVRRQFNKDLVAAWNIMYQGAIPVTVYMSNCNVMVGYDYFSSGLRTRVITEYFNIQA